MKLLNAFITLTLLSGITVLYACLKVAGNYDAQEEERMRKLCQQKKAQPDSTPDTSEKPDTKTTN